MNFKIILPASLSLLTLLQTSCTEKKTNESAHTQLDSLSSQVLKVNNQLFSIPSPIQSSLLLRKSGVAYKKSILNSPEKADKYATEFSKALNLGVYGGDLAYAATYEQKNDVSAYIKSTKTLSQELNITDAFDMKTLARLERNIGNKDSLLNMIGEIYSITNSYLKDNKQDDISSLILIGGWIEGMYLTTEVYNLSKNDDIKKRIAEQKSSVSSVSGLLKPYKLKADYSELCNSLDSLKALYEGVSFKNSLVQASTDSKNKITVISSKTEVVITDTQIENISKKITEIRKKIIE